MGLDNKTFQRFQVQNQCGGSELMLNGSGSDPHERKKNPDPDPTP